MLQGCLAAAVPVVAGGMLASRDAIIEGGEGDAGTDAASASTAAAPETGDTAQSARATEPGMPVEVAPASVTPAAPAAAASKAPEIAASRPASGGTAPSSFSDLASYALTQVADPAKPATSALLANPGALDGRRKACSDTPPVVLIDLDPAGRMLALDQTMRGKAGLARTLADLRRSGISIAWISQRLTVDTDQIRVKLAEAGLDLLGEDILLLMPSLQDTKQQRRRSLGEEFCLLAIAGDTRSDFDELFDYLKNPDAAIRLNTLRGAGWFLTPLPITRE